MEQVQQILETTVFGISLEQLGLALAYIVGAYVLRWILAGILHRAQKLVSKSRHDLDDALLEALERPLGWAVILIGIWAAFRTLPLPEQADAVGTFIRAVMRSGFIVLAIWFALNLTNRLAELLARRARRTDTVLDDQIIPVFRSGLRVFVIVVGGAMVIQELGYSITSLIAGLGIGGAAIALASKDTLSNLFGSLVIFVDRPFHVGDWIQVGDVEGTVEEVGLRVTRVRTFANSLITLPNSMLTTRVINNWSQMQKRRLKFTVGVTYDTTPDQMEQAVQRIRQVLREDERIHQDFFLVNFTEFGASSLDIFVYAFTVTTVWGEFLQTQQEILLKVMRELRELGLEIAFPTRTVHIAGNSPEAEPLSE